MDAMINSFLLVFLSEMGDKTQLLALLLAAQFKKPIPILCGILVATLLNHALASYLGAYVSQFFSLETLKWILAITFIGFGLWMLIPDTAEGIKNEPRWGPFLTTTFVFFFAEMGDKTQLATVALGAKYAAPLLVTFGTTIAMLAADGLAVYFGHHFTHLISMKWIHRIASAGFILFGLTLLF